MIRTDITEDQETQLRIRLKNHGYTLERIVHFKNYDRIIFGNKEIKISINLRGLFSEYALEAIIKACVGSEYEAQFNPEDKEPLLKQSALLDIVKEGSEKQ